MNRSALGKLIKLQRRDWADLLSAQVALLRAQFLVWTRRRGALVTPVRESDGADDARGRAPSEVPVPVRKLALALSRASEHGVFRPTCLVRAVALQRMLERRGFRGSSLHVGVRQRNSTFLAHAWVEYRGAVLADEEWRVKRFHELARLGMSQAS
jgi:hypothetical protein